MCAIHFWRDLTSTAIFRSAKMPSESVRNTPRSVLSGHRLIKKATKASKGPKSRTLGTFSRVNTNTQKCEVENNSHLCACWLSRFADQTLAVQSASLKRTPLETRCFPRASQAVQSAAACKEPCLTEHLPSSGAPVLLRGQRALGRSLIPTWFPLGPVSKSLCYLVRSAAPVGLFRSCSGATSELGGLVACGPSCQDCLQVLHLKKC